MTTPYRIGLILQPFGEHLPKLKAGIQAYAKEHYKNPWRIVETSMLEKPRIQALSRDVHAIIAHVDDNRHARIIANTKLPCINIADGLRHPPFPTVRTDDRLVGQLAADHFLTRGYRHFAFLGSSLGPMPRRRQNAFVAKVHQAGFTVALFTMPRSLELAILRQQIGLWLSKLPQPLALLTSNDSLGATAIDACAQFKLSIPQSIAILGVGNAQSINRYTVPPLSSMSLNITRRGYLAAQALDALIKGQTPPAVTLVSPGRIITRPSSHHLPISDELTRRALAFIHEHACDPVNAEDVARAMGTSRRSLERKFLQTLSTSPYNEIRRIRMERAQRLLTETDLSIAHIATVSGMGNPENLWHAFDAVLGQNPTAYRKSSRQSS